MRFSAETYHNDILENRVRKSGEGGINVVLAPAFEFVESSSIGRVQYFFLWSFPNEP
jgi:hypothetical protein